MVSYSRWSKDSSVYVFLHMEMDARGPYLTCCGCPMLKNASFDTWATQSMVDHLNEHLATGHLVPDHVIPDLIADDAENFPVSGSSGDSHG